MLCFSCHCLERPEEMQDDDRSLLPSPNNSVEKSDVANAKQETVKKTEMFRTPGCLCDM